MSTAGYPKDKATSILQPTRINDTSTTNMKDMRNVGVNHSDLKMPARRSLKVIHLPYATMTTDISEKEVEEDELCEWGLLNVDKNIYRRKNEPLYIGDTVQYFHPAYVYGNAAVLEYGIVISFDMENKTVTLNSNLTVGDDFRLRRINVYDEHLNRRVDQDGQTRSLEDFDWKSLPETAPREVVKHGHEIFPELSTETGM